MRTDALLPCNSTFIAFVPNPLPLVAPPPSFLSVGRVKGPIASAWILDTARHRLTLGT